jgi:hypothetical protein
VRGDPVRIIQLFLAALTLVGVAAMVVLAPSLVGSTHSLAGTRVTSGALAPDSVVWDSVSMPTLSQSNPQ